MSGAEFVATLAELGYPKLDKLNGSSLDWLFESDTTRPFLEWLCHHVQASNVLTSKELKDYAQIDDVLEGEHLESALQHIRTYGDLEPSMMPERIAHLEKDLVSSTARKDALVQQRNQLSIHHNVLLDKLSKMEIVEKSGKADLKAATQQNDSDNALMNEALEGLNSSVASLYDIYKQNDRTKEPEEEVEMSAFLSQVNLKHHHKLEEKFTQEVTEYTKKQFFQGISDIAGGHKDSEYKFLEIDNPDSLLRNDRQEVNLEDCKELARLQAFYPKSQSECINAIVEDKSSQAACAFFESKIRSLLEHPLTANTGELSHQLQDVQMNLHHYQQEFSNLSQVQLPALLKDSANLQVTKILRGDYDLKITRQDYFTSKQDKVVAQLLKQRARYELLTMAYEIELKDHRETHHLMTAIRSLLQKEKTDYEQSMVWRRLFNHSPTCQFLSFSQSLMREPSLSPSKFQRSTVDSRDHYLLNLNSLLEEGIQRNKTDSHQQLFVTHLQLEEGVKNLADKRDAVKVHNTSAERTKQQEMAGLEHSLSSIEKVLYADSSTLEPQLSPSALIDVHHQMDSMLGKLEKAALDIIKTVEVKKKTLKQDEFLVTERELFVYFVNDPDRLRRSLNDVESRLKAQLVK
ncbi:hypothetical protein CAPTEDRAFT_225812 [Capitella teleta]|uniref:HAUS augmin-like complex subunit 3 N-terminal domain-containing protein n=1 Tax=Capitella teleta TaxID=283909 RepID=R7UEN8_CAPTE|nr:hypothetical protein CAPTEDRAFT_225812 [Capitella teleta]|eukprot:ELU04551.1 hypothetical protein CAPTEDRAFT_225812 [Capitella teleta]